MKNQGRFLCIVMAVCFLAGGFFLGCARESVEVAVTGKVMQVDLQSSAGAISSPDTKIVLQADLNRDGIIEAGEKFETVTDSTGSYLVKGDFPSGFNGRLVLSARKDGFSSIIKTLPSHGGSYSINWALRPAEKAICESGSCTVPSNKIKIDNIPENVAGGNIQVFNPAVDTDYFPGNFEDDQGNMLISTSFAEVELYDAEGTPIKEAAEGQPFKVRMLIPRDTWGTLSDLHPETDPIEIPMFYFDEKKGLWVEQGEGIVVFENGEAVAKDKLALIQDGSLTANIYGSFEATHMSYWNIDWKVSSYACVMGRILRSGTAQPGVILNVYGANYTASTDVSYWRSRNVSGENGWFVQPVLKSESALEDSDSDSKKGEIHKTNIIASYNGQTFDLGSFEDPYELSPFAQGNANTCIPPNCPTCTNLGDFAFTADPMPSPPCEIYGVVKYSGMGTVTGGVGNPPLVGAPVAGVSVSAIDSAMDPAWRTKICINNGQDTCLPAAVSDANGRFHIKYAVDVNALWQGSLTITGSDYTEGYDGQKIVNGCPISSTQIPLVFLVNYSYARPGYATAPDGLGSSGTCGELIYLAWTDRADNEDGFRIERRGWDKSQPAPRDPLQNTTGNISFCEEPPDLSWKVLADLPANTTSHPDSTVKKNANYCYRVISYRSINGTVNETSSQEYCMTTPNQHCPPPPPSPSNLMGSAVPDRVSLTWNKKDHREIGFKITKRQILDGPCSEGGEGLEWDTVYNKGYVEIAVAGEDSVSYDDSAVSPGTCYCYRVFAYNEAGNSGSSNPACQVVPFCNNGEMKTCYTGPSGTRGVGACRDGWQICSGGVWGSCQGEVLPHNEVCDGLDNNCDNIVDDGVRNLYFQDVDGDGWGDSQKYIYACAAPSGYASAIGDCNDGNASAYPSAVEVCDGVDNDCDGTVDEEVKITYYRDADLDGYGYIGLSLSACTAPAGYVADHTDCNDSNTLINPSKAEICEGVNDENCSGTVDEGCSCTNGETRSCGSSAVGECSYGIQTCAGGGWGLCVGNVEPAAEVCDGLDNDCDEVPDDGIMITYYRDADADDHGYPDGTTLACSKPAGYVTNSLDCNDGDPGVYTGAAEVCDTIDNDCDESIDEMCVGVPSNLTVTVPTCYQTYLNWTDNSDNEEGFRIERKIEGGEYSLQGSAPANSTEYYDTSFIFNQVYYYRVYAFNSTWSSDYSNEAYVLFPECYIAGPSDLNAMIVSTSQINLTWSDNSNNEDGFKIERKTGGAGTYEVVKTVGANINLLSDSSLTPGTTYYYRVLAYNIMGSSEYSNEVSATTMEIPDLPIAAPTGLAANVISVSKIDLTWSDNSNNEDGFKVEKSLGGGSYFVAATVTVDLNSWSDTNATPSTTFYYRVFGFNSSGTSTYSNTVTATTPSS